jgi:hypothetical protein
MKELEEKFEALKRSIPDFSNVKNFELEMERVKTHIISLRGLVNKKLGSTEETETEKDKKSNPLFI